MNRDTVETHLMIIRTWASFALEKDHNFFEPAHLRDIARWMDEALELLKIMKEQKEEKQTPKPIIHGDKEEYWGEEEICPVCGKRWQSAYIGTTHFCPGCGQAVIWESD